MQVFSLLGFTDYEGSDLVGVFGSKQEVLDCVQSGNGSWYYDDLGYVVSELGSKIEDVLGSVVYVEFKRYSSKG
jgi:hypothetical protein